MLIEPVSVDEAMEELSVSCFYDERHQMIFDAMSSLVLEHTPVDIITVSNKLKEKGTLEQVGGPVYLAGLSQKVGAAAHMEYYAMTEFRFRGLITFVSDEWGSEYMHLFTCSKFAGQLKADCDEGELVWLPKAELMGKKLWAGDKLFLKALDERSDFFTLKLRYQGEKLVEARFGA